MDTCGQSPHALKRHQRRSAESVGPKSCLTVRRRTVLSSQVLFLVFWDVLRATGKLWR